MFSGYRTKILAIMAIAGTIAAMADGKVSVEAGVIAILTAIGTLTARAPGAEAKKAVEGKVQVDEMGAPIGPGPKFGALLLLLILAPGCVAQESKETAKALRRSADRLWRGSSPRRIEPAGQRAYWEEWTKFRVLADDLVKAHGEELEPLTGEEPAR